MTMKINEVAKLVGISVRTLHYYDEIGLLKPAAKSAAGYRLYTDENLATLQQILFFKELGFPLNTIKELIYSPTFDRLKALQLQRELLLKRKAQIEEMLETLERTIQFEKGEIEMTNEEKFKGFNFKHNPYEAEARERWGEAVDASNESLQAMSPEEQQQLADEMIAIFTKLATLKDQSPASAEAQAVIAEWYQLLTKTMGDTLSLDVFQSLGEMYVLDRRFTQNIDQFGEGLAQFMSRAMTLYAKNNR